jgi:hypothetical protein
MGFMIFLWHGIAMIGPGLNFRRINLFLQLMKRALQILTYKGMINGEPALLADAATCSELTQSKAK